MIRPLPPRPYFWALLFAAAPFAAQSEPPASTWCARKCAEAEARIADAEGELKQAAAAKPTCARTATRNMMQGGKLRTVVVSVKACDSTFSSWEARVAAARARIDDSRQGLPDLRVFLGALREFGTCEAGCEELRALRGVSDPPEDAALGEVLKGVSLGKDSLEKLGKLANAHRALQPLAAAAGCAPPGFVRIEPGSFVMGSPESERGRTGWSENQHVVRITRPFLLQATEVTERQWRALVGGLPYEHGSPLGDDYPVKGVGWNSAVDY